MKKGRKSLLLLMVLLLFAFCSFSFGQVMAAPNLKGTLTGVVLNNAGKPVANTAVYVFQRDWSQTDGFGEPMWIKLVAKTATAKNGTYKVLVPAGEYRVWFVPEDLNSYAMEAYPDAPIVRLGDTLTVKYGKTTSRVSVVLDTPGKITGKIVDTASGKVGDPMVNIPVSLCEQDLAIIWCLELVHTDADGNFTIPGLKPYPWQLWVNIEWYGEPGQTEPTKTTGFDPGYKSFFMYAFDRYTWRPVSGEVAALEDVIRLEYIDFPNLSGRVVYWDEDTTSIQPVEGLTITPKVAEYNPDGTQRWEDVDIYEPAITDSQGYFEIKGLTQYKGAVVLFTDGIIGDQQLYYDEYYEDSSQEMGANQFTLIMGETTDIGDWMLQPVQ